MRAVPLGALLAAVAMTAAAPQASAQRLYGRVDLDVRANLGELDLAEQAGEEPSDDSQTTPAIAGFALALGIRSADVSIGVEGAIYIGGLDLAEIEELYFGATDNVGSAITVSAGLAAALERPLRDRFKLIGRLGLGYSRMAASSGAGNARVDSFYMDVGGGPGLDLDTGIPSRIEAIAAVRVHRLNRLEVDNLTDGPIASDAPAVFAQLGVAVSWVLLF